MKEVMTKVIDTLTQDDFYGALMIPVSSRIRQNILLHLMYEIFFLTM